MPSNKFFTTKASQTALDYFTEFIVFFSCSAFWEGSALLLMVHLARSLSQLFDGFLALSFRIFLNLQLKKGCRCRRRRFIRVLNPVKTLGIINNLYFLTLHLTAIEAFPFFTVMYHGIGSGYHKYIYVHCVWTGRRLWSEDICYIRRLTNSLEASERIFPM